MDEKEKNQKSELKNKVQAALQKATKPGTMSGLKSDDISDVFNRYRLQVAQILPQHITPERILQISTTVISKNPKLKECSVESLIGSVLQSAILGFNPDPLLGLCFFVPFRKNVGNKENPKWITESQFLIGYKGFMELARRSKEIKYIDAEIVRAGDEFSYEKGLHPALKHVPAETRGKITHAYAVAHYTNGGFNFVVLTFAEIESLRILSPSQKSINEPAGAWALNELSYENMAKAKAIKQLAKYMPLSIDIMSNMMTDGGIIRPANFQKINPEYSQIKLEEVENPELNLLPGQTETKEPEQIKEPDAEPEQIKEPEQKKEQKKKNKKSELKPTINKYVAIFKDDLNRATNPDDLKEIYGDILNKNVYVNMNKDEQKMIDTEYLNLSKKLK